MNDEQIQKFKTMNQERLSTHEITIHVRRWFNAGKTYYYPMDDISQQVCRFLKQKTLAPRDISRLKKMATALHIDLTIIAVPDDQPETEVL